MKETLFTIQASLYAQRINDYTDNLPELTDATGETETDKGTDNV